MTLEELINEMKILQEKHFSWDYYFNEYYWNDMQDLIKKAEGKHE